MKRSCLVSLLAMLSAAVLSGCAATAQGDLSAASPSADQASDGPAPTALPRHRASPAPGHSATLPIPCSTRLIRHSFIVRPRIRWSQAKSSAASA